MSDDNAYKDGDIVWVKLGNNWWPGEVIDAHRHPDGFVTDSKRKLYCIVKFFNENAYEYVSNVKQIHPFQCHKKAEFIKKGLSLYKNGNTFMEKFPEDVEVAERLTRHQGPTVYINDRPDSIVKAILGQPLVLNCSDEFYGSSDFREKRKSSESVTKIINITPTKINPSTPQSHQKVAEFVPSSTTANIKSIKIDKSINDTATTRTSFGGEVCRSNNLIPASTNANSSNTYHCNICDFTSVRQNVMILHRKMHSSRKNSTCNTNASLNSRSNTKVNVITTPQNKVVKTPVTPIAPATNLSCATKVSILHAPTLILNNRKVANTSENESSITSETDISSSIEVSKSDLIESHIGESNTTALIDIGPAISGSFNGESLGSSIALSKNKPIKKIPKKRDFININTTQDKELTFPFVLEKQIDTAVSTIDTEAAESSRPGTPVAKANAEEIRKMLMDDWSDDDETSADHESRVTAEHKRLDAIREKSRSSPGPTLTSTPCSLQKSTNSSGRIRNIPKKDRRDVILHDFDETERKPQRQQQSNIVVHVAEESSNSSAVEVIEDHPQAIIEIIDEDDEVDHRICKTNDSNNVRRTITVSDRRSQGERVESNNRSSIAASILSCFDFQASDDEEDNDSSANPSVTGSSTAPTATAHFKKKYLSSEKSFQSNIKEANITKTVAVAQQEDDELAEKDQQLTAEIEKLLAITQPPPTDLLTSTNSIEECLSVKDLPIKERGKRIFKSRNRSRVEEKPNNSLSTDESFTKDITILDNRKGNVPKKLFTKENEIVREKTSEISSNSLDHMSGSSNIEVNKSADANAQENECRANSYTDTINDKRNDNLSLVDKTSDEISNKTQKETASTEKTLGETLADIREIALPKKNVENMQTLTIKENIHPPSLELNKEITLVDVRKSPKLANATKTTEGQIKDRILEDNSVIEEKKQDILPLAIVVEQEILPCDKNNLVGGDIQLENSVECSPAAYSPSPQFSPIITKARNDLEPAGTNLETQNADETKKSHDAVNENIPNIRNPDYDNQNVNSDEVEENVRIKELSDSVDITCDDTPAPKVTSLPTDLDSKATKSNVSEEFTPHRLTTTTPPTDENSSMGASDTGAEFGSPTSMLSEERLPTFRYRRNDTPQRELEGIADNYKKSKQSLGDASIKGTPNICKNENTYDKNQYHVNKTIIVNDDSSHKNIVSKEKTNEIQETITEHVESHEDLNTEEGDVETLCKERCQNLSPEIIEVKQKVKKTMIEIVQQQNLRRRYSTKSKESNVCKGNIEGSDVSSDATHETSDATTHDTSERAEKDSTDLGENLQINSDDNETKPQTNDAAPALNEIVVEHNKTESENDSIEHKELEKTTKEKSFESKSIYVDESQNNSSENLNLTQEKQNITTKLQERVDDSSDISETNNTLIDVAKKIMASTAKEIKENDSFGVPLKNGNSITQKLNLEEISLRSPSKRSGEIILSADAKQKRHDSRPEGKEDLRKEYNIFSGEVEDESLKNKTAESEAELSEKIYSHTSIANENFESESEQKNENQANKIKSRVHDLIIECKTIVSVPTEKNDNNTARLVTEKNEICTEFTTNAISTENEDIRPENNTIGFESLTETTGEECRSINSSAADFNTVSTVTEMNEEHKAVKNETPSVIEPQDFSLDFDNSVNQTDKQEFEDNLKALKDALDKSNEDYTQNEHAKDFDKKEDERCSQRDHSSVFNHRSAIKRRKTICYELAEFGLKVGESPSRKRQVIDFEDSLPEDDSLPARRTAQRKMTLPATFDFNSQFKSFKPRRRSSIEENMRNFAKNWTYIDEELIEEDSSKASSQLAAKQIGVDSKGNKYIVIKDVSAGTMRRNRSDSSDSSFLMAHKNSRTLKRKSSESKATTSKATTTKACAGITNRRLSLPAENTGRILSAFSGACVAIKPKITRDQVINSLNDNQLSTAQQQLMQLQQQQQQQQQIQSLSMPLNKQTSNRMRKTHRTQQQQQQQQGSHAMQVQQIQLQQPTLIQQQPQIITPLSSNQQNVVQIVAPHVQSANEGFIIATAASTEDEAVIDSNTQLIALPTQPYPGYTETFLLCKVNGNTCKPVDNVPLYLNHQLNELVPIPLEVLENAPKIVTNEDGTIDINQVTSNQELLLEDKTAEQITIEEMAEVVTDPEISNPGNILHEQYIHDTTLTTEVNEEEVNVDLSTNNGILLNIEGQQVLLDAATFEHLLANPDANTQLISDDGTEYVLTHEVLQALYMQQQQEQQQQQQILGQTIAGSNNDIIAVAMAGSELYGNGGVLTIDTTQAVQLLDGSAGMVFQQPPTALMQQHLTPPAVVTNAVLDQSPIMSTLEVPSGSRMQQVPHCTTVSSVPIVAPANVILGSEGGTHPNLDDSLAAIGVTAQTSSASSSVGLPITVTDPNIASKVTSAGPLNEMLQFVSHRPATAAATAAAVAAAALAGETRIFND